MFQSGRIECVWGRSLTIVASLLLSGCGSDSSSNEAGGGGEVTAAWRDGCIATFTSDVAIKDPFGSVAFTAHAGSEYLITDLSNFGNTPQVEIAYLTAAGPDIYKVPVTGGPETFPFTSNCTIDTAVSYYAAFTDVTVYDSEALTNEICKLPAGTTVKRDMTTGGGYAITTMSLGGPQIYQITLNALGALCGGATLGYVSVPETKLFGSTTWLVPIQTVMKPH